MLFNPGFYKKALDKLMDNEAMLFVTGLFVLVIGFLLVSFQSTTGSGLFVVITLVGWAALIKGLMIVLIPVKSLELYEWVMKKFNNLHLVSLIVLIIGVILAGISYAV